MAVVKANAYGHGLLRAAAAAQSGGASCLGVASVAEGAALREGGIEGPIVVLGAALLEQAEQAVALGLSQTVSSESAIHALASAADRQGRKAHLHLKLETGMGRIGVYPEDAVDLIGIVQNSTHLELEGVSTHIGWGDDKEGDLTAQVSLFKDVLDDLRARVGIRPRWTHAANSLATTMDRSSHFDLVRVGLLTYGIPPTDSASEFPFDHLTPALSIHARLTQVRALRPGQHVSYGGTHIVDRPTDAAIVPVGYGDGYPRTSTGKGSVLFGGQRCPILGVVCMDQFVIDVTGLDAAVGDEVTLLGSSASESITANDLAQTAGRIPYEIVAGLTNRLPCSYQR